MDIVIASNNQNKIREYKEMLEPIGFNCLSLKDVSFNEEIIEDGSTFKENSYIKAKTVFDFCHLPVIADDSGISVDALGGAPGIYSQRYSKEGKDKPNRDKLMSEIKSLGLTEAEAHFTCAITYIDKDKVIQKEGYFFGTVKLVERGNNGFGYDPIFYPLGKDYSVAELSDELKNKISHRHNALELLIEELK